MGVRNSAGYIAVGLAAGTLSGLFGVGGGVIIVPLLVLCFHFAQRRAQAASLVAIVAMACAGAIPYALHQGADLVAALVITAGGLAGSYAGSAIARRVGDDVLKVAFALLALATAVQLLAFPGGAGDSGDGGAASVVGVGAGGAGTDVVGGAGAGAGAGALCVIVLGYLAAGLAMGAVSSLVGVGGGIVLVPILVFVAGMDQQQAQGLSLIVMVPIALMGAVRNSRAGHTDWRVGACIGLAGAIASPLAASLALSLDAAVLQRLFGGLLCVIGVQFAVKGVRGVVAARRARTQL